MVEFKGRKGNVIPALEQVRLPISGRGRWDWRIENHRNLSLSSSPDWQDYGQTGRNRITAHLGNCSGKPPARVLSSQRNTCISVPALQNHFLQASGSPSSGEWYPRKERGQLLCIQTCKISNVNDHAVSVNETECNTDVAWLRHWQA